MFRLLSLVILFVICTTLHRPALSATIERREISQDVLDQLTRFTKFSSAAYQATCSSPLGNTLVQTLNDAASDTQGYIARDDTNKQIIVAFRGSTSAQDSITDAQISLTQFTSQGVSDTNNSRAHSGFLSAYNSVASTVLSTVSSELDSHPNYTLVSTGHSLGAAIASISGVSLASNFPDVPLQVFTFGQPRTGDSSYAQLAENLIGTENIFRAVHTTDGVPTIIPTALGYQHHATEFWQFQDPSSTENVKQCSGGEDSSCSASVPSGGINAAHLTYFGQTMGADPTLCV